MAARQAVEVRGPGPFRNGNEVVSKPIVREIEAKSILNASKIYDYCLNPYTGCGVGCVYCYAAQFMRRYSGHSEPWGQFVDVKVNAPEILAKQIVRAKRGSIWISSVCDPYQPIEARYRLTRRLLEVLIGCDFPVAIQTKSARVLRDLDLIRQLSDAEVGFTIATEDERIAKLFEPHASPISERIDALRHFRRAGIATYAFCGPLLPGDPDRLAAQLGDVIEYAFIDRMNYVPAVRKFYQRHGLTDALDDSFFEKQASALAKGLRKRGVSVKVVF